MTQYIFLILIVSLCFRDDQTCFIRVWQAILWIDNWKKGILYLILGAVCFTKPHEVWMAIISGKYIL